MLAKQQKNIRKSKEMFQCFYRLKKDNYFLNKHEITSEKKGFLKHISEKKPLISFNDENSLF